MTKKAAHSLKPRAQDVFQLGLCDEVIKEPGDGAHSEINKISESLLKSVRTHFAKLIKMPSAQRMKKRYEKYREFDQYFLSE
jgi:acetyl-CoA carboxylase carboxyl transferase subunit alpha